MPVMLIDVYELRNLAGALENYLQDAGRLPG
jgi:hypothetical protein